MTVFDWYINQLAEMFNAPTNTRESCSEILSRLIAENYYNHALVINSDVDLRKNSSLYFVIGLAVILLITWQAIEWKTYDKSLYGYEALDVDDEDDEEEIIARKKKWHPVPKNAQIIFKKDILYCLSYKFDAGDKLAILDRALEYNPKEKLIAGFLPELEGDKCTFIGSTFLRAGDIEPYLNHCVVLNTCEDTTDVPNSVIESYETEREMLLGWRDIIQKEDPDIIIGYNIFGFDYIFMHTRAEELGCLNEFMQLSRNTFNKSRLAEKQIRIASGTHNLSYLTMEGRIQIDLYNHFRREVNLPSYKLDYVASHFIGDYVTLKPTADEGYQFTYWLVDGLAKESNGVIYSSGAGSSIVAGAYDGITFDLNNSIVGKVEAFFSEIPDPQKVDTNSSSYKKGFSDGVISVQNDPNSYELISKQDYDNKMSQFPRLTLDASPYTLDWYYQPNRGWMWTKKSCFPYIFDQNSSNWLFFEDANENPRFYEYESKSWILLK